MAFFDQWNSREAQLLVALVYVVRQCIGGKADNIFDGLTIVARERAISALIAYGVMEVVPSNRPKGRWTPLGLQVCHEDDEDITMEPSVEEARAEALNQPWEKVSARERDLLRALVYMVEQHLPHEEVDGVEVVDSWAMSDGERAVLALARYGLLEKLPTGRIMGRWTFMGNLFRKDHVPPETSMKTVHARLGLPFP